MNAYIIADQRWAFGRNGGLLFSLPTDLEHFHSLTRGGTVIMGLERLRFYTGGEPLPQRRNIVVTRDLSAVPEGAEGVSSPEEALALAGGPEQEDLWIIGGGSIYATLLSRCSRVYLTRVETRVQESDTFFPNLDKLPNWEVESTGELMEEDDLKFRFIRYVNTRPRS
ncbi:dihydrofolate reductase [uncultured Oscillibacter sp.]|uniref:dihydrofolate reductase n=1 Tax=uncultured Oscillibacter sp. TaxID=876091 RepID=UPI0025E9C5EF|nr:dihydrofolate reductase [uncultured Oscillibacter sp.]